MDRKHVTEADKKSYFDFVVHHLINIASRHRLVPLFHYTRGHTLIEIIRSGSLWATQIANVNDAKEVRHAIDLYLDGVARRRKAGLSPDAAFLFDIIEDRLQNSRVQTLGTFVVCFSEDGDDLNQWRSYGGKQGYVIEFDTDRLTKGLPRQHGNALLLPVEYEDSQQRMICDDAVQWTETFFLQGLQTKSAPRDEFAQEFLPVWFDYLGILAPMLKQKWFAAEKEWRIVYYLHDSDIERIQVVQRDTMMTRHVPLHFSGQNDKGYTPLPIVTIKVGPSANREISRIAVGDLLRSKGYGDSVQVDVTTLPLQDV